MHNLKLSRTIYQQSKDYDDTLKFLYKSYLLGTQNVTLSTIAKYRNSFGRKYYFLFEYPLPIVNPTKLCEGMKQK